MSNRQEPWEMSAFPQGGEENADSVFRGVGRVMSGWEAVEFTLSRLHSAFEGDADGISLQFYGKGRIFRERIGLLTAAAEMHFRLRPNQDHEGRFDRTMREALGFSERRNEVAHGIVLNVSPISLFRDRMRLRGDEIQYALIPPYYHQRSHDEEGFPLYSYNAVKLTEPEQLLLALHEQVDKLRKSVIAIRR